LTLLATTGSAHASNVQGATAQAGGSCAHGGCFASTIAFTTTRDSSATTPADANDAAEIYLMNPDPTDPNPRQLTENAVGDGVGGQGFANLSPDGKRVVFDQGSSDQCGGQTYTNISNLYVMDADGSNQRFLTRGSSATWSPDGQSIAFHASASYYKSGGTTSGCPIKNDPGAATTDSDIFVANVDALLAGVGRPRNLTDTPGQIEDDADWSAPTPGAPDGRIAFTSHPNTDNPNQSNLAEINVMKPNGSSRQQLTFNSEEERAVAWSPDATRIVYSCRIGGGTKPFQICVMNADGTNVQQLTADAVANLSATWSPDGQQIVFNKLLPRLPGTTLTNYQLFTMNPLLKADGSRPDANEITCAPGQDPPYAYPCPDGVARTAGINLLAHWGVLRV
jgi:Tol biopolymer transport system component